MAEVHAAVSSAADESLRSEPTLAAEVAASTRATPVSRRRAARRATGNYGTNGVCAFRQTLVPGQVIVLDLAGPLYAAISAVCTLRPNVQGQDDVGHQGLSN